MLNCAIVDDEPLAREGLFDYVSQVDFLTCIGRCANPLELTTLLGQQPIDLIFLDIQMPVMNGIDFLKMTANPPLVIITTAYPSFALEGFQLDVLDYLVKPITFSRFFKAVTKARDYQRLLTPPGNAGPGSAPPDYFFIKVNYKYERIYFNEILFIQALQNYVTLHTTRGKYITQLPLKNVEEKLDPQLFIRVHKSFIVSIPKIEAIENQEIIIQSVRIPISRNHSEEVLGRILNDRLWRK